MLKGRQTGSMHRGHSWVFRAESHDTMLAWYEDVKNLTEKSGEERNAFVRRHARSISGGSQKAGSISSEGAMDEDEADQVPYSANASLKQVSRERSTARRPQPGGRFPSDLQINRDLRAPLSPSSESSDRDHDVIAEAGALPGSEMQSQMPGEPGNSGAEPSKHRAPAAIGASPIHPNRGTEIGSPEARSERGQLPHHDKGYQENTAVGHGTRPLPSDLQKSHAEWEGAHQQSRPAEQYDYLPNPEGAHDLDQRTHSNYGGWMAPGAAAVGGATAGAVGNQAYRNHEQQRELEHQEEAQGYHDAAVAQSERTEPSSQPAFESTSSDAYPYAIQSAQQKGFGAGSGHRFDDGRPHSNYGEWMEPAVTGSSAPTAGVAGTEIYHQRRQQSDTGRAQPTMYSATNDQPTDRSERAVGAESLSSASRLPPTEPSQTNSETTVPTTIDSTIGDKPAAIAPSHDQVASDNHDVTAYPPSHGEVVSGNHEVTAYSPHAAGWHMESEDASNPPDAAIRPGMSARSYTISDLHVPGEYPPTPAPYQASFP